jgi:hypothetical protein
VLQAPHQHVIANAAARSAQPREEAHNGQRALYLSGHPLQAARYAGLHPAMQGTSSMSLLCTEGSMISAMQPSSPSFLGSCCPRVRRAPAGPEGGRTGAAGISVGRCPACVPHVRVLHSWKPGRWVELLHLATQPAACITCASKAVRERIHSLSHRGESKMYNCAECLHRLLLILTGSPRLSWPHCSFFLQGLMRRRASEDKQLQGGFRDFVCTSYDMALQQRPHLTEHEEYNLIEDVRLHWRQPKLVLGHVQSWDSRQPVAVEALAATLAGGGQVCCLASCACCLSPLKRIATDALILPCHPATCRESSWADSWGS